MQQMKEKSYTPRHFHGKRLLLLLMILAAIIVMVVIVIVLAYHVITENHSIIMACVV
jgi:hypothetical protein